MNNGRANTHPDNERVSASRAAVDDFGLAVARVAVAQVCESVGFKGSRGSTLDSLADIAVRYIRDIGMASRFYANLAGRSECNAFDIIRTLDDLGDFQGVSGASAVRNCIVGSGMMREVIGHVEMTEEIPFAHTLPWFPVSKERRKPMLNGRKPDLRAEKLEKVKQRRKAERSLLNLQQRLANYGQGGASASGCAPEEDVKGIQSIRENPYLAPPLQMGEEDVQVLNMPDVLTHRPTIDNHGSIFRTFAPAIEAMRNQFSDDANGDKDGSVRVLPDRRHSVQFKFKMSKKVLGHSLDLDLGNRIIGKSGSVTECEEERDDKKRRASCILRQSMENPVELTQL
ncbi:hypothetical protein SAY86_007655 [Trapa natans]|uniref:Bromodomain associated domain-containing protein n=1 Tax=Trapa natans TaxID=22666 RepID=A0AAN7LC18_TRANT|nr:hypothetical protein SAY86_007655 [Trapa natans]